MPINRYNYIKGVSLGNINLLYFALLLALLFSTGSCAAATADTVVWNDLIDPAALAANSAEGVTDAAGIELRGNGKVLQDHVSGDFLHGKILGPDGEPFPG